MSPTVPNQVWVVWTQKPHFPVWDEPEPGEPQVPPPGHQARQLEPRRGLRGRQGRGEAAQEGWVHDNDDHDDNDDDDVSLLCEPWGLPPDPPVSVQSSPGDPRHVREWVGAVLTMGLSLSLCCLSIFRCPQTPEEEETSTNGMSANIKTHTDAHHDEVKRHSKWSFSDCTCVYFRKRKLNKNVMTSQKMERSLIWMMRW